MLDRFHGRKKGISSSSPISYRGKTTTTLFERQYRRGTKEGRKEGSVKESGTWTTLDETKTDVDRMSAPIEKLQPGLEQRLATEGRMAKGIQASVFASRFRKYRVWDSSSLRTAWITVDGFAFNFRKIPSLIKFSFRNFYLFEIHFREKYEKTRRLKYSRHEDRYLQISRALNESSWPTRKIHVTIFISSPPIFNFFPPPPETCKFHGQRIFFIESSRVLLN